MSTIQTANIDFTSTGSTRIQYTNNDTFKFVAGNTDVLSVNSTSVLLLSLSTYANNSDAVSAGLVANTLYKTSNGEIRIVV